MSMTCPCLCNVHINLDFLERFRESDARNTVAAVLSGILFFSGWWIIIDAAAAYPVPEQFDKAYHTIGVVSTVAFFMMNSVTNQQVRGDTYDSGCFGSTGARIWIFTAFVMAFSALIAAMWIFFGVYIVPNKDPQYPGLAIFLQNVLIFLSGIIFKFGRLEESY